MPERNDYPPKIESLNALLPESSTSAWERERLETLFNIGASNDLMLLIRGRQSENTISAGIRSWHERQLGNKAKSIHSGEQMDICVSGMQYDIRDLRPEDRWTAATEVLRII